MKNKFILLVGDGMSDFPCPELHGKTPLEYAATPAMDAVARAGYVGRAQTVPEGLTPGSDVANMALMGYDPVRYYSGRAPIEAASLGIELGNKDIAFRCNLVHLADGKMVDYSSGHIETSDACAIIAELQVLNTATVRFFPGASYRHLVVISDLPGGELRCSPPHSITNRTWQNHLPAGAGESVVRDLMDQARVVLKNSAVNKKRIEQGKVPVTDIWLWGQGRSVKLPTLAERFSICGSVISAVDLIKGLGILAGLTVRKVSGATGYLGTNYAGKVAAAVSALQNEDFVFLHVEAPDETSHEGDLQKKIQAIEEFDRNVVAEFVALQHEQPRLRILVSPDHHTPVALRDHHGGPVPFAVCGSGITAAGFESYNEKSAARSAIVSGEELFAAFITGTFTR